LGAILQWQPSKLEGVPVFQIHGRRDLLIPARLVDADEYIPDGGHLINVTHAEQVNAFIGQVAAKVIH
jgi:pimeloyl-ACP methyl ester carboxylesterase